MGHKARCCSIHLCLFGHRAPGGEYECLHPRTPVTFAQIHIQPCLFAVDCGIAACIVYPTRDCFEGLA